MALVIRDRVKESSTTTGTGTFTLAGADAGYQGFSSIGDGNTTYYAIVDSANAAWEVGIGTYTASGTTLSRDTVLESSNSGSLVDFAASTKAVFCTYPAERSVTGASGYTENDATISISSTITAGRNAVSGGPISIDSGVSVTVPTGSTWTIV